MAAGAPFASSSNPTNFQRCSNVSLGKSDFACRGPGATSDPQAKFFRERIYFANLRRLSVGFAELTPKGRSQAEMMIAPGGWSSIRRTTRLPKSARRQQCPLEGVPVLPRQEPHVNGRVFRLNLDSAAIRPRDFQLRMRVVPARCCP